MMDELLIQSLCVLELFPTTKSFLNETFFEGVHVHTRLHLTETWGGSESLP